MGVRHEVFKGVELLIRVHERPNVLDAFSLDLRRDVHDHQRSDQVGGASGERHRDQAAHR